VGADLTFTQVTVIAFSAVEAEAPEGFGLTAVTCTWRAFCPNMWEEPKGRRRRSAEWCSRGVEQRAESSEERPERRKRRERKLGSTGKILVKSHLRHNVLNLKVLFGVASWILIALRA